MSTLCGCLFNVLAGFCRVIIIISSLLLILVQLIALYGIYSTQTNLGKLYSGFNPSFKDFLQIAFMLYIGLIGCYGAWTRNARYLKAFATFLSIAVILTLVFDADGGLKDWRKEEVEFRFKMSTYAEEYKFDDDTREANKFWDALQSTFLCCGLDSPKDWINSWKRTQKNILPGSCCLFLGRAAAEYPHSNKCILDYAFDTGCYDRINSIMVASQRHIITVTLVFFALVIMALIEAKRIERDQRPAQLPGSSAHYQRFEGSVYVRQNPADTNLCHQLGVGPCFGKQAPVAPPPPYSSS